MRVYCIAQLVIKPFLALSFEVTNVLCRCLCLNFFSTVKTKKNWKEITICFNESYEPFWKWRVREEVFVILFFFTTKPQFLGIAALKKFWSLEELLNLNKKTKSVIAACSNSTMPKSFRLFLASSQASPLRMTKCILIFWFYSRFSESQKTEEQKEREVELIEQLVSVVNKRDQLVQFEDSQLQQ